MLMMLSFSDDDESAEKRPSKAKQEMTNADDTVPPQVQASYVQD